MKKRIFLILMAAFCSLVFAKKKETFVDNTFLCAVHNESDFGIEIDGISIAAGKSKNYKFPLHTSALYDGWSVSYKIPLTSSCFYVLSEKKSLADGQKDLKIENPQANSDNSSYIIVKNRSKSAIQIKSSSGKSSFPCYQEGIANGRKDLLKPVYIIASGADAVLVKNGAEQISICNENSKKTVPLNFQFAKGYACTIEYSGKKAVLKDSRPIHLLKEKLWNVHFPDSQLVREIKSLGGKYYAIGTEILSDKKKNRYSSGFVCAFDRKGEVLWKQTYAAKNSDTFFYDLDLIEEKLCVAAQTISDDMNALFLCYDLDGKLVKSQKIEESIGFEKIEKNASGDFVVFGYDSGENPAEYAVSANLELKKLAEKKQVHSKFVQSESAKVFDGAGNLFVAGELAGAEMPVACIAKISVETQEESNVYMAKESFSYITDMKIKRETGELLICGSLSGKDESGNFGKPFIRCIDSKSGKVIWENIFETKKYEIAVKIASCDDYGFIAILANSDDEGELSSPSAIVRVNSVGKPDF